MAQQLRRLTFAFRRSESDRTLVEGIAYLSLDPPASWEVDEAEARLRIDSWGTWMRRDVLEKFAHDFLTYGRAVDSHHDHGPVGNVVESYLTREGDPAYPPHVWVVKSRVYDTATLAEIDAGELTGFSIEFLSELKVRTLLVGASKVRTGEIVNPVPIFLSLVKNPAIGQPFAAVERRSAPPGGVVRELTEEVGRVTRMWRCAMDENNQPKAPASPTDPAATPPPASPASAIDGPAVPQATPQSRSEHQPRTAVPALTTEVAKSATAPAVLRRAAEEALGTERCVELQQRAEGGSFAEAWKEIAPRAATWATIWEAIYLLECVVRNVRWGAGTDQEQYAAVEAACRECAEAIGAIAEAGGVTVAMRSAHQRAGAKHSKKTLEAFDTMHGSLSATMEVLEGLRAKPEGKGKDAEKEKAADEAVDEEDAEQRARAARETEVAALRTRQKELEEALAAKGTELDAARTALTEATGARQRAEAQVKELEGRRPAPQSRSPQGDEGGEAAPQKRSSSWGLFHRPSEDD